MSEELMPCPFCGEDAAILDGKSDSCRVRCESCGTEGRPSFFNGDSQDEIDIAEEEARYGWNTRSTPKQGEAVCWIDESHLNELAAGTEAWNPAHAREFSGAVALFRAPKEPKP